MKRCHECGNRKVKLIPSKFEGKFICLECNKEEEEEQGNPLDELLIEQKTLYTRWKVEEDPLMKESLLQKFLLSCVQFNIEVVKGGENKTK